jgi:hypothetical protein
VNEGSVLTIGGNLAFEGETMIIAFGGARMNMMGNITANTNKVDGWLFEISNSTVIVGGNVETNGNGASVETGGMLIIKRGFVADGSIYLSVDGKDLTKDGYSVENVGPYGGHEYINDEAEYMSFVYTDIGDGSDGTEEEQKDSVYPMALTALIIVAMALLLICFFASRRE